MTDQQWQALGAWFAVLGTLFERLPFAVVRDEILVVDKRTGRVRRASLLPTVVPRLEWAERLCAEFTAEEQAAPLGSGTYRVVDVRALASRTS